MRIQSSITMKYGPQSLLMMDPSSTLSFSIKGRKIYLKQVWKLTSDGLWSTQLTDKITLTSHNPLIFSSVLM